jgi:hypothetical protein
MTKPAKPLPVPVQPVVQPPRDVVLAAFTKRELDAVRTVLRDSDSEVALRHLTAALARAGK